MLSLTIVCYFYKDLCKGEGTHNLWRDHFSSLFLVIFVSADNNLDFNNDVELAVIFMLKMILNIQDFKILISNDD